MQIDKKSAAVGGVVGLVIAAIRNLSIHEVPENITTIGEAQQVTYNFASAQNIGAVEQACTITGDANDVATHLDFFATYWRSRGSYPEQIEDPENPGEIIDNPDTTVDVYNAQMVKYFNDIVKAGGDVIIDEAAAQSKADAKNAREEATVKTQ